MTYQETIASECNCGKSQSYSLEKAVETSTQLLDLADQKYGPEMVEVISDGASGLGPMRNTLQVIGYGKEAINASRPGDIIISRGLFPESEPNIEIVGLHSNLSGKTLFESYDDDERDFEVLRPSELGPLLPWAARAAASPAGRAILTGTASGLVQNAGSGGSSGGGGTLATINQGITTANNAIDLGVRVVSGLNAVSRAYDGLRYSSQPLSLMGARTPANVTPVTNVWTFDILAKYSPGGSNPAKFPITVNVRHDCFNIYEASVVPGYPQMNGDYSDRVLPDMMRLTIAAVPSVSNALPAAAQFKVEGDWSVRNATSSNTGERFRFFITVRANGSVSIGRFGSSLVSRSRVQAQRGPSVGRCQRHYGPLTTGQSRPSNPRLQDPRNGKHIMFTSGSSRVVARARAQVQNWWSTSLRPAQRSQISSGSLMVTIQGHADRTGSQSRNQALSAQRASVVAQLVRELAGPNLRARVSGSGEDAARRAGIPDGTNAPQWRRVTITI